MWKKYGTGPNDPTTREEREEIGDLSFGRKIQKYYREIEKELNIRKKDSVSSNELKEIINKIEEIFRIVLISAFVYFFQYITAVLVYIMGLFLFFF